MTKTGTADSDDAGRRCLLGISAPAQAAERRFFETLRAVFADDAEADVGVADGGAATKKSEALGASDFFGKCGGE